eukprot:TRINITY_DN1415_c0_g2_i1.p1 TRINITY_DN1415_c0_g2~~TRINITY_DN1415_c0_g2_i1.p1  ORF type:complete len:365 (-),score=100.75 TRINITY_DN1415_c0_g2_i1:483-1577(-)
MENNPNLIKLDENFQNKVKNGKYWPDEYPVEVDNEGYTKSFSLEELDKAKEFFDDFGFVVVNNVLTNEECELTIDEIWEDVEETEFSNVKRNDPKTWDQMPGYRGEGIVGGYCIFSKQFVLNRMNPNIYKVFEKIYGNKKLLSNQDRAGLFRPTKNEKIGNKPKWTTFLNLHFDCNPWKYVESLDDTESNKILNSLDYGTVCDFIEENNYIGSINSPKLHVQASINLADNKKEDGGFIVVPGFKKEFVSFVNATKTTLKKKFGGTTFVVLPKDEPVYQRYIRVCSRAGSLIIWQQVTPHGSAPNTSGNFRYAQFLKFFTCDDIDEGRLQRRTQKLKEELEKAGTLKYVQTDLGKKLFGFEKWEN